MLATLWREQEGLTTVEYALLLALVAVAAIAVWSDLGCRVSRTASSGARSLPRP